MYSQTFIDSWNKLSRNRRNSTFKYAVRSWCIELKFDEQTSSDIERSIPEWVQNESVVRFALLISGLFDFYKSRSNLLNFFGNSNSEAFAQEEFKQHIRGKFRSMEGKEVPAILIIAFVLVGAGFLVIRLKQNSVTEETQQSIKNRSSPIVAPAQTRFLVLVVSADRQELLHELEAEGRIKESNWNELYSATQFLWLGTEDKFLDSELSKYFSNKCSLQATDLSEYDVCFICLELVEVDSGFQPNVLQIDRRDAFERLPQISKRVRISPRLSNEAYAGKGFYKR